MRIQCYRLSVNGQFVSISIPDNPNPNLLKFERESGNDKVIIYYNNEGEKKKIWKFVNQVLEPVEDMQIR